VTIVTPSYNQGDFVRATIESVLSQDYPDLEYIVMDGGSTDQTAAIAAEYGSRLTWISEKDRGQAHAINKGFKMASGQIVAWLNSDDLLLPGAVGHAVSGFEAAPSQIGGIYGEGYLMDRAGRITGRFPATESFNLWKLARVSDYVLQQSTFMRRAAVEEIGWLDEELHYVLDWDLFIRLGKRFGLQYIPEFLGVLREYPEAKTFSGGRARVDEIRRLMARHAGNEHAPGYWIYYLDTLYRQFRRWTEEQSARNLRAAFRLLSGMASFGASGAIFLLLRSQGLFPDRNVGPRLRWMLPQGSGEIVIRGIVPEDWGLARQSLSVHCNGKPVGSWSAGPGPFAFRLDAGYPVDAPVLDIRASHSRFVPGSPEPGFRRVAWVLDTIEWSASQRDLP